MTAPDSGRRHSHPANTAREFYLDTTKSVSIRLLDPVSWTSPERFVAHSGQEPEGVSVRVHPWVWQTLAEYAAYFKETTAEATTLDMVAESILERALLADEQFQK